jgi:hypothetical protein
VSSILSSQPSSIGVRDVRKLRQVADDLLDIADQRRAMLIEQLGLKRYIFNTLGKAAHRTADGAQLVWPDGTEQVENNGAKLGDYLCARARKEQRLPQAILIGDDKFYL